jgi:hypothetical protein
MSRKPPIESNDPSPEIAGPARSRNNPGAGATGALLNEDEAAAQLGLTASDLYHRRRRGDGPPFVRLKNRIFYVTADLDGWVAALPRFQSSAEGYAAQALAGAALAKKERRLRKIASGG